jgi:hypothetical protein
VVVVVVVSLLSWFCVLFEKSGSIGVAGPARYSVWLVSLRLA